MFCVNCRKELPADARFCYVCGNKVTNIDDFDIFGTSQEDELKETEQDIFQQSHAGLTLAEFRQNAPVMVGHREELLAFRKSLSNSWDYNAYVGILLM